MTILLLNASYEPLSVIPRRRAVSLLMRGRVDAASQEQETIRGASTLLHLPKVLRLRKYVNVPRRGANWSRNGVMRRDNWRCIYCGLMLGDSKGGKILAKSDLTIDHIVPRSRGGRNTWTNTACACAKCNQRKQDRLPHEAGMKMLWEPKTPRVDYLVASGEIPDAWKVYLEIR